MFSEPCITLATQSQADLVASLYVMTPPLTFVSSNCTSTVGERRSATLLGSCSRYTEITIYGVTDSYCANTSVDAFVGCIYMFCNVFYEVSYILDMPL